METLPYSEHRPVLYEEAVAALDITGARKDGVYVDGTFGRGGHSRLVLAHLSERGHLIAFDKDPQAIRSAKVIEDPRFSVVHGSFASLGAVLDAKGIAHIDGILLDLGVSSPQLAEADRGFSFRLDGPLDMRMDTSKGESAAEWLARENEERIAEVIREYGEERFAVQVAKAIVAGRSFQPVTRTRQLAQIVAQSVKTREKGKDPATRTFQAIRIYLNQELEDLSAGLAISWKRLALHGRMAVISFHSLEDRIVKRFFAELSSPTPVDRRLPIRAADTPPPEMKRLGKKKAGAEEVRANPRARSAILRVAERVANPHGEHR
ncbi:MAG: 16S rRNA (cytosine(1402)-N(4))-methyltransferase RsmH [Burkholderiaceae bacterium]|jgi:16S rRNA (cytosine1402-N4)-methyltransferase|nr:16S rRNA (cytosine(1402)-N(4))-methyltransferase RsmH [Burkholderiaceae bacterium]